MEHDGEEEERGVVEGSVKKPKSNKQWNCRYSSPGIQTTRDPPLTTKVVKTVYLPLLNVRNIV